MNGMGNMKQTLLGLVLGLAVQVFAADTDIDGMDDAWESTYFGDLAQTAEGDYDADGRTNGEEFADGTDPVDPGSTLGLVAYYPFDGDADDESGNGYNGTEVGATIAQDRFGSVASAYQFDGVDDYIDVGDMPEWSNHFSVSCWIKPDDQFSTQGGAIFYDYADASFGKHVGLSFNQPNGGVDRLKFVNRAPNNGASAPVVAVQVDTNGIASSSAWHMLTAVRDGTNAVLYLDGIEVGSDSHAGIGSMDILENARIGDAPDTIPWTSNFKGGIDDVRIYNRSLTPSEVARLFAETMSVDTDSDGMDDAWETTHFGDMAQTAEGDYDADGRTNGEEFADGTDPVDAGSTLGLVAYYPLDGDAADASGNGNDGTAPNGMGFGIDQFGRTDSALALDGFQYIELPAAEALLGANPSEWSYSVLFNTTDVNLDQTVLSDYNSPTSASDYRFGVNVRFEHSTKGITAALRRDYHAGGTYELSSGLHGVAQDQWQSAVVSISKLTGVMQLYTNGTLVGETALDTSIDYIENEPVYIGATKFGYPVPGGFAGQFYGSIDNVRIYNRVLSSNEVARLFAATVPVGNMPVADAGEDGDCFVGESYVFEGSGSENASNYLWSISSAPAGSSAALSGAETVNPSLVPDVSGDFEVQLLVDNGATTSTPDTVVLTAEWLELVVESDHGTPFPGIGTNQVVYGSVVTNSVDAAVTNGNTLFLFEDVDVAASPDWTLTAFTNHFVWTVTNHTTISWNWSTKYWVEALVSGSGQVTGGNAWFEGGATASLSAMPEYGWLFMGWNGDLVSGYLASNETLVVDAPKSVVAVFSDDADNDGLLNTNEWSIGSNPRSRDSDSDGFDDYWEVVNGSNPTNSDAKYVDYIRNNGGGFDLYASNIVLDVAMGQVLMEVSGSNATLQLQLESSGNLLVWTNAGEAVEWNLPVGGEKRFFRVRAE